MDFARFGALDASVLYRYNSALTYSLVANGVPLTAAQRAANPGYATPPTSQTVYFGERGAGQFDDAQMFDLAFTYSVPVFRQLRPWIKAEVFNLFNDQSLVNYNTVGDAAAPEAPLTPTGCRRSTRRARPSAAPPR